MYEPFRDYSIQFVEYQSVCPFVGIGAPPPRKRERLPPWTQRGEEQHSFAVEGVGGPNSNDWKESLLLCILCRTNSPPAYSSF
jgi:hypothetical protein